MNLLKVLYDKFKRCLNSVNLSQNITIWHTNASQIGRCDTLTFQTAATRCQRAPIFNFFFSKSTSHVLSSRFDPFCWC